MNLMTRGHQTRHQLLSNRARRTCHKHSHRRLPDRGLITYTRQDSRPGCDTQSEWPRIETHSGDSGSNEPAIAAWEREHRTSGQRAVAGAVRGDRHPLADTHRPRVADERLPRAPEETDRRLITAPSCRVERGAAAVAPQPSRPVPQRDPLTASPSSSPTIGSRAYTALLPAPAYFA